MDKEFSQLLAVAVAGGRAPADLVLTGGRVINVFTGEIESLDIAISGHRIAGVGRGYSGRERIDLGGAYVAPGLIDAHVHIESSLCTPAQFASAILPRGVTAVVTDPHEIANVAGVAGVNYIAEASRGLPLDVTVMAPSCVPATHMASSGAAISADDIRALRAAGVVHGLAEVMNFPGVISADASVLDKLAAMSGRPIDGHCPGVTGAALCAYVAAGVGSDHESITRDEAREKLARGLYLLIREATNARNLDTLLAVVTPQNSRRICFCTDDRTPGDLLRQGSIDYMLRRAIAHGIDPIEAIRMATLNTAEWFGLHHVGAIAPGRLANLMVFDDLAVPTARQVFARGRSIAQNGTLTETSPAPAPIPLAIASGCRIDFDSVRFEIPARTNRIRVIGARPDQLVTDHLLLPAKIVGGFAVADPEEDVLKMAVIERHHATGRIGLGFIRGFGLRRGAIAGTVAHDHHNLICIGADDESMMAATRAVAAMGGGLAVCVGANMIASLPLPIAGLMSDRAVADVAMMYDRVLEAAREIGACLADPFMAMSFMALEVIPSLKLTDRGLVDVEQFKFVDLFV
ncbi:MAG: adenine deaminase [Burkholderiales bacterium]|nr:adenine deaminase [Phycisphaerae bacterium]